MSKRRSARVAVWAAAGVLGASAISMLAVPATAATPTVTFTGGCSLLSSTSKPDSSVQTREPSADKAAEVIVVNELNAPATPYANGEPVTTTKGETVVIQRGGEASLPFSAGTHSMKLVPDCALLGLSTDVSKKYDTATITVAKAPRERNTNNSTQQSGGQTGSGSEGSGSTGSGSDSNEAAGGADSDNKADGPGDPVARDAAPPAGDKAGAGDSGAVGDSAEAPVADGSGDKADGDGAAAPMLPTNHNRGPATTTLALVAVVCLLGVGAAALRTVVVARATRMSSI